MVAATVSSCQGAIIPTVARLASSTSPLASDEVHPSTVMPETDAILDPTAIYVLVTFIASLVFVLLELHPASRLEDVRQCLKLAKRQPHAHSTPGAPNLCV
ncbi:hypothetical protein J1614_006008 [Plenodomus biglobosus]|nr:hypothetical protein J1614_006008 [Plenodomus biglobosus]